MARGKNVHLFLMDGEASGRIKCTLNGWTGVVYKIPRTRLEACVLREDLKYTGVYFLFGISDDTDKPLVYVGQANARKNEKGILGRLQEHKKNPEKDYWTEAVVVVTSDNTLDQADISYLENKFYNLAVDAGRYEVKNGNEPMSGNITEEKECSLEDFAENIRLAVGTLGHKVFEPIDMSTVKIKQEAAESADNSGELLYLKRKLKAGSGFETNGIGRQVPDGFVVLAGSIISPYESTKNISSGIVKKRATAKIDENRVLQENILFGSPSSAAMFVIGNSANGWNEWKRQDGSTMPR